jgi:hypothetical protein
LAEGAIVNAAQSRRERLERLERDGNLSELCRERDRVYAAMARGVRFKQGGAYPAAVEGAIMRVERELGADRAADRLDPS